MELLQEDAGTFLLASWHMLAISAPWGKAPVVEVSQAASPWEVNLSPWGAFILLLFHLFITYIFTTCQIRDRASAGCWAHTVNKKGVALVKFRQAAHTHSIKYLGLTTVLHLSELGVEQWNLTAVALTFSPTALPVLETANPCLHMAAPKNPGMPL